LKRCGRLLVVSIACTWHIMYIIFRSEDRPLNAVKLRSFRENVVFGPPIFRGGYTPDFRHTFSNRTHFRASGWFAWVPFSELRG